MTIFLSAIDCSDTRNDYSMFTRFFVPRSAAELSHLLLGPADVQESSKMASDAGILVHKVLLQYPDEKVRYAVGEALLQIAASTAELGTQLVDLMSECLNVQHNECTRCKHFFLLLTTLLTSNKPTYIKEQPMKMYKAAELSTVMLSNADKMTLSNEMLYEVMSLLNQTMLRHDQSTHKQLSLLAERLMPKLSKEFLMRVPGSKRTTNVARTMARRSNLGQSSPLQVAPLCDSPETREAAWCLLHTIVTRYLPQSMSGLATYIYEFAQATRLPVKIHWNRLNSTPKEDWEHKATVERRKLACVGLKNQGATCYMNAMMQQLFLDDSLRKTILTAPLAAAPPEKAEELWKCPICTLENDWSARMCLVCEQGERPEKVDPVPHGDLLRQMQRTFRFMVDSELQSFDPIQLVDACRDLGLHFKVTSQNDSSEFLDKLLERLEREVGGKEHSECLKSCFRVRVSSQLVSVECSHRKPINAGVFEKSFKVNVERMGTLERAIEDALAGELMTGDSRVDCEKCTLAGHAAAVQNGTQPSDRPVKRAMKRTLFLDGENLPSTVCVQLNRFQFQGNGFVKLNDRLAFPTVLDLAPHTKPPKGQDDDADHDMSVLLESEGAGPKESNVKRRIDADEPLLYELKGIVVHSGQFSFGHYYSFAKDPITGKWLKLDDDQVSEFDLADLESECFGGIQTTVNKWTNCVYKTEKTASAYMLFYQRCDGPPISTPKKERTTGPREASTPDSVSDAMMDDLQIESPAAYSAERVESAAGVDEILDTNEQMLRRSLFFDEGFSGFVLDLLVAMEEQRKITKETMDMALTVFYKSVLHAESHPRLQTPGGYSKTDWLSTLRRLLENNEDACVTLLDMCVKPDDGPDRLPSWLEGGLVVCPLEDVRLGFCHVVCVAVKKVAAVAEADAHFRNQVKDLVMEFVEAVKDLVPVASQHWRHLAHFGMLIETMAATPLWCERMIERDVLALLLHLYLGQMSPGIKSSQLPKIATMGTTNPWPNGRMEPNCDALLRGVHLLYSSKSASSQRWPRLTDEFLKLSTSPLAQKLCTTDPMGGSCGGDKADALILNLWLMCLKSEGFRSAMVEQIRQQLLDQLEKQGVDIATRVRQSQSAQALSRFLRASGSEFASGDQTQVAQWNADMRQAKEQLLRQLVMLECYQQPMRQMSYNPLKRIAQVLVLAGQDQQVCNMLEHMSRELETVAHALIQQEQGRQMSGHAHMNVRAGSDAHELLSIIEETLTRVRQMNLPNELYVSVTTQDSALKGVYPLDRTNTVNQLEQCAGFVYTKTIEHNVGFQICKEVVNMTDKTGNAVQAEYWVLSSVNGTRYQPLYRTQNGRLSPDRFPRPTARWRRCTQRNQPQGEECDMEVLGQWSDDVSYVRRNSDYASVNCKGMESSSKMDIGGPNSGGVKSVHFNDDNASDSASDEAIAGSDQEGGDEQTGT
jgi:ubiquitin C-terminal hydrolase